MTLNYCCGPAVISDKLRTVYENDANALTAVSAVFATHLQTIAEANQY